jgi:hypothetical protein
LFLVIRAEQINQYEKCASLQVDWKAEIKEQLQQIKSDGSHYPQLEEELVRRRREELRWVALEGFHANIVFCHPV